MPRPRLPLYDPDHFEALMARATNLHPDDVPRWLKEADMIVTKVDQFRGRLHTFQTDLAAYGRTVLDVRAARPLWSAMFGGSSEGRQMTYQCALAGAQLVALDMLIVHLEEVRSQVLAGS